MGLEERKGGVERNAFTSVSKVPCSLSVFSRKSFLRTVVNDKLHLRNECEADKQDKQEYHLNYNLNPPIHISFLTVYENQRQVAHTVCKIKINK